MTNREGFFGQGAQPLAGKGARTVQSEAARVCGRFGRQAVLAIAQDGVEHDVGHFRVAAGGGLLSKSQSMGGPIRDEAGGGIGTDGLKASSFAQHDLLFHRSLRKQKNICVNYVTFSIKYGGHLVAASPMPPLFLFSNRRFSATFSNA